MQLTKRSCFKGGCAARAIFINSRFAADPRCSADMDRAPEGETLVADSADDLPQALLAHPTATEARAWFATADGVLRTLGESDSQDRSRQFVEDLYASGAVRVVATEIVRYTRESLVDVTHHENTGHLVVELPADPAQRKRLFRIQGKAARGLGFDPTKDSGQRYLFFMLD